VPDHEEEECALDDEKDQSPCSLLVGLLVCLVVMVDLGLGFLAAFAVGWVDPSWSGCEKIDDLGPGWSGRRGGTCRCRWGDW